MANNSFTQNNSGANSQGQQVGENHGTMSQVQQGGGGITAEQFLDAILAASAEPHAREIPEPIPEGAVGAEAEPDTPEMLFGAASPFREAAVNPEEAEPVDESFFAKAKKFAPLVGKVAKAFGRGAIEQLTSSNPVIAGLVKAADVVFED